MTLRVAETLLVGFEAESRLRSRIQVGFGFGSVMNLFPFVLGLLGLSVSLCWLIYFDLIYIYYI